MSYFIIENHKNGYRRRTTPPPMPHCADPTRSVSGLSESVKVAYQGKSGHIESLKSSKNVVEIEVFYYSAGCPPMGRGK